MCFFHLLMIEGGTIKHKSFLSSNIVSSLCLLKKSMETNSEPFHLSMIEAFKQTFHFLYETLLMIYVLLHKITVKPKGK